MKTKLKSFASSLLLIGVLALTTLLAAPPAHAGVIGTGLNGGTNTVLNLATNDYRAVTTMTFASTTAGYVGISAACTAASTANYDVTFDTSVDGSRWQSNAFTVRLVGNGGASVTTNYAIPKEFLTPQVRVGTIANTNITTPTLTNVNVTGFSKSGF